MEYPDLITYGVSEQDYALRSLQRWLRYEGLAPLLGGSAFFVPYGLVVGALVLLAIVFVPYLLWKLFEAGWYKSIITFVLLILVPLVAARFMEVGSLSRFLLVTGPLAAFYIYTWVLAYLIGDHLKEAQAIREVESARRRRET